MELKKVFNLPYEVFDDFLDTYECGNDSYEPYEYKGKYNDYDFCETLDRLLLEEDSTLKPEEVVLIKVCW